MKISFIGASGMLGKPVARELIRCGFQVKLLGRDPDKLQKLFPGTEAVNADVFDKASLDRAFENTDVVYLNLSVPPTSKEKDLQPEREGVQNIIQAAKEKNLRRIVYLSSLIKNFEGMEGFHWWAFQIKQKAVDAIKASGIPYTIFYPSSFMETLPYQMIKGNKLMLLGKSVAPMWWIAADDYAKQVSKSFQILNAESREYPIQGPEPLKFDEAGKIFADNYKKRKLKIFKLPLGIPKFFSRFNQMMDYGVRICDALNRYPEQFASEKTWAELGKPGITVSQYAASF